MNTTGMTTEEVSAAQARFEDEDRLLYPTQAHSGAPVGCTVNAPLKNTICVEPLTTRNS